MEGYFYGLLATCLFCGICGLVSPEGPVRKYIRLLGGICILCVMLSPLPRYFSSLEDDMLLQLLPDEEAVSSYGEIYNQSLVGAGEREIASHLESVLCAELSLEATEVSVRVALEADGTAHRISDVWVTLRGGGVLADPRAVAELTEKRLGVECVILYE